MIKTVDLCEWIDGTRYYAVATVNTETEDVSLESEQDLSGYAYYKEHCLCKITETLKAKALAECECYDNVELCFLSDLWGFREDMVWVETHSETVFEGLAICFRDEYYFYSECAEHSYRDDDGERRFYAPDSWWDEQYWCNSCCCYVPEWYYHGDDTCDFCYEEEPHIIEGYCESHGHDPVYFGEYKGEFCGLGVELEVDCDYSQRQYNEEVAAGLCRRRKS